MVMYCFFFFFQAEDGIRDIGVTGVQTCALPILVARGGIFPRGPAPSTHCRVLPSTAEPGGGREDRRVSLDVDALLTELTLAEKASLTSGSSFWYTRAVERLGIPRLMVADGPHGLRAQPGEGDHVGLGGGLPATCFPTASAVASSWNPDLLRRIGEALGREARAIELSVILGPGINMKRSPLCGRNFEYFSEDPFLAGELGVGIVDGIQAGGVGTSVKHFAAKDRKSTRLNSSHANISYAVFCLKKNKE